MESIRIWPKVVLINQAFNTFSFWSMFCNMLYPEHVPDLSKSTIKVIQAINDEGILISTSLDQSIKAICYENKIYDETIKDTLCLIVKVIESSLNFHAYNKISKTATQFKNYVYLIKGLRKFLDNKVIKHRSIKEGNSIENYTEMRFRNVACNIPAELAKSILFLIESYTHDKEVSYNDVLNWNENDWKQFNALGEDNMEININLQKQFMVCFLNFLSHIENKYYILEPVYLEPVQKDLLIGKLFILGGLIPEVTEEDIPHNVRNKKKRSPYSPEERVLQQRMNSLRNRVLRKLNYL